MKFKAELVLLLASISLFIASAFCFSYDINPEGVAYALSGLTYPFRVLALPFVGSGGALMMIASISYSKRVKSNL